MAPLSAIKITQSVIDRLQNRTENCCGALFGSFHNNTYYVVGLFKADDYQNSDLYFPADVDMCGAFQVGELNKEQVNKVLKDVDVTDTPIFISVPDMCIVLGYHVVNNKLDHAQLEIVEDKVLYSDFIHVRLKAQIPFSADLDTDAVNEELLKIRNKFSSGKIAFQFPKQGVFLLGNAEKSVCGYEHVTEDMSLAKLCDRASQLDIGEVQYSRSKMDSHEVEVLPVVMYRKATFDNNNETDILYAPVIQMEKCDLHIFQILLKLDAISLLHKDIPLNKIYTVLVESACRNLRLIGDRVKECIDDEDTSEIPADFDPEVLHFFPPKCGHFVTRVVDKNNENEDNNRAMLHKNFMMIKNKPYFRRGNRFVFKGDVQGRGGRLINPHEHAKPSNNGGEQALVSGKYEYYHYCQDGMDDDGWGCAYRSLQTLASWLHLQGYTEKPVPTFKEIQKCLYDIGDKPAKFVDSRQWIGSTEVNFVLESMFGYSSKILFVSTGEELSTKGPELVHHFNTSGSPIMIGGGVLAHTILGVDYNRNTGELKFLILDPHYKGNEDIKTIVNKGWCGWKGANFWDKKSYYNMCMPLIPDCI